jgi:hypothetical protein
MIGTRLPVYPTLLRRVGLCPFGPSGLVRRRRPRARPCGRLHALSALRASSGCETHGFVPACGCTPFRPFGPRPAVSSTGLSAPWSGPDGRRRPRVRPCDSPGRTDGGGSGAAGRRNRPLVGKPVERDYCSEWKLPMTIPDSAMSEPRVEEVTLNLVRTAPEGTRSANRGSGKGGNRLGVCLSSTPAALRTTGSGMYRPQRAAASGQQAAGCNPPIPNPQSPAESALVKNDKCRVEYADALGPWGSIPGGGREPEIGGRRLSRDRVRPWGRRGSGKRGFFIRFRRAEGTSKYFPPIAKAGISGGCRRGGNIGHVVWV